MYMNDLILIIPAVITAFVISYLSMPVIIRIANLKQLISAPDGIRKLHGSFIPTLGGIGILSAFIISFSVWGQAAELTSYPFFIAGLFLLFLTGIKDDITILSPVNKLIVQLVAALLLVVGGDVVLTDMGGILGLEQIPRAAGAALSVMILIAVVNAFNLIDGIDGLAGGIGIIVSGILGIWFWGAGFMSPALLSFTLTGALIGFLIFNMHPAKIFMGDTGAMATGFILGFLALEFLSLNAAVAGEIWHMANAQVFVIAIMIIPVIDTLRVVCIRLMNRKNPMIADRNHTHHMLIDGLGMAPNYASFSLWIANILIIGFAYSISHLQVNLHLLFVLLAAVLILPVIRVVYLLGLRVAGVKQTKEQKAQTLFQ